MTKRRIGHHLGPWALTLILLLPGCGSAVDETSQASPSAPPAVETKPAEEATDITLFLAYSAEDSLYPYYCSSLRNFYLSQLLYDPLFRLSPEYTPEPTLAEKAEQTETGRWVITLGSNVTYHDGTPITAEDVEHSFWLALESPYYNAGLRDVQEIQQIDERTIEFTLIQRDSFFPCSLVFPIVHATRTSLYSGRFIPDEETGPALVHNPAYRQPPGQVKRIVLDDVPDDESANYSLKSSKIDLLFTDMRNIEELSTNNSYSIVPLNNLVFIGINRNNRMLDAPIIKSILNDLTDRPSIIRRSYLGQATAVKSPFNPFFFDTGIDGNARPSLDSLNSRLDEAGCNQRDTAGYRLISGQRMSFRLLCNAESEFKETMAQAIVDCYKEAGIEVEIRSLPFEEYQSALANGHFDLYIGEIRLSYNMNLMPLLNPEGAAGYGVRYNSELIGAYRSFRTGETTGDEFCRVFDSDLPFIPVLYRRGELLHAKDFFAKIVATEQDVFYNILEW